MSKTIRLLAIDPSLSNFGLAKLEIDPITLEARVLQLKLVETSKGSGKQVRVSSDDKRRATESYVAALAMAQDCDLLAAEIPTGGQSARAALSFGIAIGLCAALGQFRELIEVNPSEVKKTVTGRKTASKDEMIAWATSTFPDAPWLTKRVKGVTSLVDKNEHIADACAIGVTAIRTNEFKSAVRMLNAMRSANAGGVVANLVALH